MFNFCISKQKVVILTTHNEVLDMNTNTDNTCSDNSAHFSNCTSQMKATTNHDSSKNESEELYSEMMETIKLNMYTDNVIEQHALKFTPSLPEYKHI
jgi:hypothetical protein